MKRFLTVFGEFAIFLLRTLSHTFSRRYRWRSLLQQMSRIGVESLTVVNLCAFFIGLVMVLQSAYLLAKFGAKQQVATLIALAFVREIGPVFAAIMFAGRVGTGIAAEIGSMVVTEQIDAYRAFGIDPVARLATPRVLATAIMLPALTVIAVLIGIASGLLLALTRLDLPGGVYIDKSLEALSAGDLFFSVTKGFVFGILIGTIGTFIGFRTRRTTEAVGDSTTQAMVTSVLAILIADLALTLMFMGSKL